MLLHFCSFPLLLLAERFKWPGCYALSGTVRPEACWGMKDEPTGRNLRDGIGPDEFQLDESNLSKVSEPRTQRVEEDGNDGPSTTAAEPKPRLLKQKEKGKPNA
jgi:hypothetical protein